MALEITQQMADAGSLAADDGSPCIVPPFNPPPRGAITYYWWSWHPRYPRWSQSCWKAATIKESVELLNDPRCSSLSLYHNKLIQHDGVTLVEVMDVPCKRLDVWRKCIEADKLESANNQDQPRATSAERKI